MDLLLAFGWTEVGYIALVVLGLSAVIFVHELGHFLVARMCGVKCEKFYIGFDVPIRLGPLKLPSSLIKFTSGECEYGVGILPLGGYVKMLGQVDNPSQLAEELRSAKVDANDEVKTKTILGPDGEEYEVDARSYLAKSVPQRMAIISAGVIMNVIFAFIFAVIAYRLGVPYQPTVLSATQPGSPAWEMGLKTGDEIVELAGKRNLRFRQDLTTEVMLNSDDNGLPIKVLPAAKRIERAQRLAGQSQEEPIPAEALVDMRLLPSRREDGKVQKVGAFGPSDLRFAADQATRKGSAAAKAKLLSPSVEEVRQIHQAEAKKQDAPSDPTQLRGGDRIVAINGEPIFVYAQLAAALAKDPTRAITIDVQREHPNSTKEEPQAYNLTFEIGPQPMKRLGLVMATGPVEAVRAGAAVLQDEDQRLLAGDFIEAIDDQPVGDPFLLPGRMLAAAQAKDWVKLKVTRKAEAGEDPTLTFDRIAPEVPEALELESLYSPLGVPALGIAVRVLGNVVDVMPNSPAAKAGLQAGDVVVSVNFVPPAEDGKDAPEPDRETELKVSSKKQNWPFFVAQKLQADPPGTTYHVTYRRGDSEETTTVTMKSFVPEGPFRSYTPMRGLRLAPLESMRQTNDLGEMVRLGLRETGEALMLVYRILSKLGDEVPLRAMGGPVQIAKVSYSAASQGLGKLLVFLTLLSANLAVLNFLPIPVLDGGHMVLLAYEGLTGRPPKESVVVVLQFVGLALLLTMMIFVFALDLGFLSRNLE